MLEREQRQGIRTVTDGVRRTLLSPLTAGLLTACCLVALELRVRAHVGPEFGYLRWNLFLAWIPLVLAYPLAWTLRRAATWPAAAVLGVTWLLFLPNAPYLVTDMIHLEESVNAPNALTLALVAFTGLLLGIKSVELVQAAIERRFGAAAGWHAARAIAVLTALGIYLGRVHRWNSWNLVSHPGGLLDSARRAPAEPGRVGLGAIGIIVCAAGFYAAYRTLTGNRPAAPMQACGGSRI